MQPFGDQAIFVKADRFEEIDGYREIPLMEDYDLACRLKQFGQLKCLNSFVKVSARGLEYNLISEAFRHWVIPPLYRLGVSPTFLANLQRAGLRKVRKGLFPFFNFSVL